MFQLVKAQKQALGQYQKSLRSSRMSATNNELQLDFAKSEAGENHDDIPGEHERDLPVFNQSNLRTFFSTTKFDFGDVISAVVIDEHEMLIPLEIFLKASECHSKLYERFGGTLMLPFKDVEQSHVNEIRKAILGRSFSVDYVQVIVLFIPLERVVV